MCPTELMKALKAIEVEISQIYEQDEKHSAVSIDKDTKEPLFESNYNYLDNRRRVNDLQMEERKIKKALSKFNSTTNVEGYNFTVGEGLVKIGQLRREIHILTILTKRAEVFLDSARYSSDDYKRVCYNIEDAKADLKLAQRELSDLQVAIDRTNLNSNIDY